MSETRNFLTRRQAALEAEMQEALARARAPYEAELKEIRLAIAALDLPTSSPAAGPAAGAKTARGRRKRSLGEMVLMALRAQPRPADISAIQTAMERRWNCAIVESRLAGELARLQRMGMASVEGDLWRPAERGPLRVAAQDQAPLSADAKAPRGLLLVS
jgi:hypothetical protein